MFKADNKSTARKIALAYWNLKKQSKLPKLKEVEGGWFSFKNNQAKGIFIEKDKESQ